MATVFGKWRHSRRLCHPLSSAFHQGFWSNEANTPSGQGVAGVRARGEARRRLLRPPREQAGGRGAASGPSCCGCRLSSAGASAAARAAIPRRLPSPAAPPSPGLGGLRAGGELGQPRTKEVAAESDARGGPSSSRVLHTLGLAR